jgi:hypothetical protein
MKAKIAVLAAAVLVLPAWQASAQQVNPPARVVIRADGTVRHRIHISPGFNLFMVFDAPVEFVAVGDDRLVSVYLRAEDGIVGLRASQQTGRTSLHVYSGGILVPFEVLVERGVRSADVVSVIVRGQARSQDAPPPQERPAGQGTGQPQAPRHAPGGGQPSQEKQQDSGQDVQGAPCWDAAVLRGPIRGAGPAESAAGDRGGDVLRRGGLPGWGDRGVPGVP